MTNPIETERLLFRPYEPGDRALVVALLSDPEVMRFVGNGVLTEEAAERAFERTFTHVYEPNAFDVWGVFEKEGGAFAGHAEIKPRRDEFARPGDYEIIYVLTRAHWGRGYATEIARRLVEYGLRELKLGRVVATVDPPNAASIRVLEKVGMRLEEEFEDEQGRVLVYAVRAEDFDAASPRSGHSAS